MHNNVVTCICARQTGFIRCLLGYSNGGQYQGGGPSRIYGTPYNYRYYYAKLLYSIQASVLVLYLYIFLCLFRRSEGLMYSLKSCSGNRKQRVENWPYLPYVVHCILYYCIPATIDGKILPLP